MFLELRHHEQPFLELAPSPRIRRMYLILGALLVALPAMLLVTGSNNDRTKTAILIALIALFGIPTVQAMTRRMRFFDTHVSTRLLGVWVSRLPPADLEFEELVDNLNPYAGIAAAVFKIPNDVVARRSGRRRIWLRIPGDLLSCLTDDQYERALRELGEHYGRRTPSRCLSST